jgi:hypothetical protein
MGENRFAPCLSFPQGFCVCRLYQEENCHKNLSRNLLRRHPERSEGSCISSLLVFRSRLILQAKEQFLNTFQASLNQPKPSPAPTAAAPSPKPFPPP